MHDLRAFLISLSILINSSVYTLPLPYNQYAYMEARHRLTAKELNLNEKEKIVNLIMQKQKLDEFDQTVKYFYPARPIETELKNITNRPLYDMLKKLPKGGNLHIHEFQMLDRKKFLEFIVNSPEYDWLHICDPKNDPRCSLNVCNCFEYSLKYFAKNPANGWIKVNGSNWDIDSIVAKTTLTGMLNEANPKVYQTDSNGRWELANKKGVFNLYAELTRYNKTRFDYLKACLDNSLEENVQLIEFRRSNFGNLFYFNETGDEVPISATEEMNMIIKFKKEYKAKDSRLIDFIFLIYGSRGQTKSAVRANLDTALQMQAQFPDMIRGYDLVGEEDAGHTLLFHSDTLMKGFNYSQSSNGTFDLVFHTVETSWPQDLAPAQYGDSVTTLDNIYDSILLKTHRVGHGFGLFKHPELYKYLQKREIAVEVCPSSNQILGYSADLRNHPAINYYRNGIPIVIAGDDPGSFGYNDLTVDYYLAYMAWGFDLYDFKKIANNSIKYSSIPNEIKIEGYQKFSLEWDKFIDQVYESSCKFISAENNLNISDALPTYGPNDKFVDISLYGYKFETAICQKMYCIFGSYNMTEAQMVKINEIKCKSPITNKNITETVSISLQIGNKIYKTGYNYTFLPSNLISLVDDEQSLLDNHSSSLKQSMPFMCSLISFYFLLKIY